MKIKTGIVLWLAIVIAIVAIGGFSISHVVSDYFKNTILQRDVDINAKFIALQARQHLTLDDFTAKDFEDKKKTYTTFLDEINTDEMVRLKVWSLDKTVVYSDQKDEIGQTFSDNDELNDALDGEVKSEISDLEKSENTSEQNYKQLMEIYIPIKSDSGNVIGVIETYTSMNLVNTYIENTNQTILFVSVTGIGFISLIIVLAFSTFRNNLINPILHIRTQTKKIQEGDFDIKSDSRGYDEVKKLETDVEIMASKLKEQQASIVKTERLSAIGELAVRMAHDLRNPLSLILSSVSLLKYKYAPEPEAVKYFDRVDKAILRMTHQIDNVMDFVATKELELDTVSLNGIIKNAVDEASIPDSIKINLPSEDLLLTCDPSKLEIVFDNILVNAKQAIDKTGTIDIRTSQEQNMLKIEIHDSGSGIPSDVLPNIFEPLFTTKQEGTGLGLPSCKNIVELHGGQISVKSEQGKGTTFVITLPILAPQKQVSDSMVVSAMK